MLIISKDGTQVLNMDNVIALRVGDEGDYENNIIADYPDKFYTWEEYPTAELALAAMKLLVWRTEKCLLLEKGKMVRTPTDTEAQEWLDHEKEA